MYPLIWATTTGIALLLVGVEDSPPKISRGDLGGPVKWAILVDKVMQPEEGWVTKEWIVRATAEAGFNVFSPRKGHDRLEEVQQVTEWCEKYGIYHLPWMRGTLSAPEGPEAEGKRLVWPSGNEQPLWSPNSDEFWEWTHQYIVEYAKISATNEHLIGVFLDYENYAPGREANCYSLSYEDLILDKFAQVQQRELPHLELSERKAWLEEQGLHEEFAEFQIHHWRQRCRTLREAVDEFNPKFQFCIYPAPGTPFMVEACYPEWATAEAPLILADPWTYGRPSRFLPQGEALEGNRQKLLRGLEIPQEAGIPFTYVGGIDPVVQGADPEFCGKNAVMISEVTDGYWVFYEGPKYHEDHPEYWKWFTWANQAVAAGRFEAWKEPRETPEDWTLAVFPGEKAPPHLIPPQGTGQTMELPAVNLRGENLLVVAVQAGKPVEITLRNRPVARNQSLLVWELRNPQMEKIQSGTIPHDQTGTLHFTPETEGLYLLGASAGSCAYSVVRSNVPLGLFAGKGLSLIYGVERLYFKVPEGVPEFSLTVRGAGAETVRVNVFDPEGQQVATGQTTPQTNQISIKVATGTQDGETWSLALVPADEGVLEDSRLTLDPQLPPTLSLIPEHVFEARPEE